MKVHNMLFDLNKLPPSCSVRHQTNLGMGIMGDSRTVLDLLPDACCDLAIFSPPFEGADPNNMGKDFTPWLMAFFEQLARVLKPKGSLVFELGQSWQPGTGTRTVHGLAFLTQLLQRDEWLLLQEFHWYNPQLLPTEEALMTEGKRFADSVTQLYWIARSPDVDADTARVNSNHVKTYEGCLSNLLTVGDGPVDVEYARYCAEAGGAPYRDRFPVGVPGFFIDLTTKPGDLVLDPFAGCYSTGAAAEMSSRRWICSEYSADALATSSFMLKAAGSV